MTESLKDKEDFWVSEVSEQVRIPLFNKNSYDFALKDGIFSYRRCQIHIVT